MGFLIRMLGFVVALCVALPMPWKVRVWLAALLESLLAMLLKLAPSIYRFVIGENQRHGMGKQRSREMESIMELEIVLKEIERLGIRPETVKDVLQDLRSAGTANIDLPRGLAIAVLGEAETKRLLNRIVAF